ncbi:MAG: hypothetical protein IT210_13995 [Armatimonadetes bacterium]|nr:hypothetical protein [Armatimonadota bacterium]
MKPIKIAQQCPACRKQVQAKVVQEESTDEFLVVACPMCEESWELEIDFQGVDRTLVRREATGKTGRERAASDDQRRGDYRKQIKKGRR